MRRIALFLLLFSFLSVVVKGEEPPDPFHLRGRIYLDWFGLRNETGTSQQLSNRLKMDFGSRPGQGWTVRLDIRDRHQMGTTSDHQLIVYDTRFSFDDKENPLFVSIGQMNLFDTAGIGQLLGGVFGYKLTPRLLIAGYGGLQPDVYATDLDPHFRKFGLFARYQGPRARTLSVSVNEQTYLGVTERRFLYINGLAPIQDVATIYGNLEYELGPNVQSADRFSRIFLNARFELTRFIDVTGNYSTGRGLDFHRFLVEQAQESIPSDAELERYFYNTQYGLRVRFKLSDRLRVTIGQRESLEEDNDIRNHTTQLGLSANNLAGTGLSLYGSYNINRGDRSESDSLYVSASKSFGRFSLHSNYSTSFNSLRFDSSSSTVEIIHIDSRHSISNELYIILNRALGVSVQHEHAFGRATTEDLVFLRLIYKF